ncbi:MAG: DUF1080 domain-containing protein [Planctomycetes bacterium]|nr:DUF1080 domain-containing protein [Planctomycetota bacterium]
MRCAGVASLVIPLVVLSAAACAAPSTAVESPGLEHAWRELFDGASLGAFASTPFGGEGEVSVVDGRIVLDAGSPLTGVTWGGEPLPQVDYELELSATRLSGNDFFCGLTLPIGDAHATLVLGGWGGALCGLSSLDGRDASENETTTFRGFESGREYRVRVLVTATRFRAWLDGESIVDVGLAGRRIGMRPEVARSRPFGIACFATRAAVRGVRVRGVRVRGVRATVSGS